VAEALEEVRSADHALDVARRVVQAWQDDDRGAGSARDRYELLAVRIAGALKAAARSYY
jgi:hypothetical protein